MSSKQSNPPLSTLDSISEMLLKYRVDIKSVDPRKFGPDHHFKIVKSSDIHVIDRAQLWDRHDKTTEISKLTSPLENITKPLSLTGKLIETEKKIYHDGRPVTQRSKNRIFNPFHTITSKISNETQVFENLEDTGYDSSEETVKQEAVARPKSKSKIVKSLLEPCLFEKLSLGVETILYRVLVLFNILRSLSSIPDNAKLMTSDLGLMHVYACLFKVSRKFKNKKVQTVNDFNVNLRDSLPDIERLTLKETHGKKPDKDKPDLEVKEEENSNDSGLDDFNERLETALESVYRNAGFQYQKFSCSQTLIAVMTEIEVDAMVTVSNLAFEIDFIEWPEKTVFEVINTILTSITQNEDCEFWDGIDDQTPSKHNLAIETLIKLSTKLSNMDMIWMTPGLGIMEKMISVFVSRNFFFGRNFFL